MSTIKHPVGPQPSKVYWRRRLVVLIGLVAVIAVIVLIFVRPGAADAKKPDADKAPASTGVASDAATDAAAPDAAAGAGDPSAACNPAQIAVEAVTDAADYSADQKPALSLVVTNTGATACTLDVGTAAQIFTVKSGDDVYWTSTDCQLDGSTVPYVLEAGKSEKSAEPTVWDRTRSAPETCDAAERDVAPAEGASYHLTVSVDGIESTTSKQFILN